MSNYEHEIQEFFDAIEIIEEENKKKSLRDFEKQLNDDTNALILEAVNHFSKHHFRKGCKDDFDERYFYNEKELKKFLELNKNPKVKIRTEYDDKNPKKIFCYIAYR